MQETIIMPKDREGIPRNVLLLLEDLPLDRAYEVTVREHRRKRSDAQNAALFGYGYKLLRELTGYELPEIHDVMLRSYFGEVEYEVMGRIFTKPRRTTTRDANGERSVLTTLEFSDFFAHVQREAAKLGLRIDDPSLDHYLQQDQTQDSQQEAAA